MLEIDERPVADSLEDIAHPAQSKHLIGHGDAFKQFEHAWKSNRLHHAWLISGPKGIGKATLAFHLSKALFASGGQGVFHGPGTIDASIEAQVANGSYPNLLHLTKPWDEKNKKFKTQLSVDEIRRTLAFYGLTAGADGWRVTIVDAADDMNASAANALLKILEEPPKKSVFFVITHSAGSLLPTIRSRCQRLPLQPLTDEQSLQALEKLGVQIGNDLKSPVARLSKGSVRQAVQLLNGKVIDHFAIFEKLMEQGAIGAASEWGAAHKVAEALARRGAEQDFQLFTDLVLNWIGSFAAQNANSMSIQLLAGWADVWEKANRTVTVSDAFNLDRKQVVLNLFGFCFERHAANRN